MAQPELLVSILMWYFRSQCVRSRVLVQVFHRWMKAFLAIGVKKSVLKEVAFAKSHFLAFVFLNLVRFKFLDLANFVIVNRFSISLLISQLLVLLGVS